VEGNDAAAANLVGSVAVRDDCGGARGIDGS
jgi:hypothetical protein